MKISSKELRRRLNEYTAVEKNQRILDRYLEIDQTETRDSKSERNN